MCVLVSCFEWWCSLSFLFLNFFMCQYLKEKKKKLSQGGCINSTLPTSQKQKQKQKQKTPQTNNKNNTTAQTLFHYHN